MKELIEFIKTHDKVKPSTLQIILTYPGFKAIYYYKIANFFSRHKMNLIANMITFRARKKTGIEIAPKATLGKNIFIDHGFGVVIGEDAVIGDNVIIYQGVTLGAKGTEKVGEKRHPTIGNNVIIGANSIILGHIKVGDNSIIGAGSVILHDVNENSTVIQKRR